MPRSLQNAGRPAVPASGSAAACSGTGGAAVEQVAVDQAEQQADPFAARDLMMRRVVGEERDLGRDHGQGRREQQHLHLSRSHRGRGVSCWSSCTGASETSGVVPQARVELATFRLGGWYSNRVDLQKHTPRPRIRTTFAQAGRWRAWRQTRVPAVESTGSFDAAKHNIPAVSPARAEMSRRSTLVRSPLRRVRGSTGLRRPKSNAADVLPGRTSSATPARAVKRRTDHSSVDGLSAALEN